jgi:hypothetical protein
MVLRHVRWTQHCSHLSMRQVHWGQGPVRSVSGSELSTRDRHSSLLQLHVLCPVCFKSIPVNQTIAFCEPFLVSNEPVSVTPESERFLVSSEPVSHSHRSHRASLKYQTGLVVTRNKQPRACTHANYMWLSGRHASSAYLYIYPPRRTVIPTHWLLRLYPPAQCQFGVHNLISFRPKLCIRP